MARASAALSNIVNLDNLDPKARNKITCALHPRDTMFARRFNKGDIKNWGATADRAGMSTTAWMEDRLNKAADRELAKSSASRVADDKLASALHPRDTMFARRFNQSHIERWDAAAANAGMASTTAWIEAHLNRAVETESRK